jgi:thiol-disulfide isomerase/thioredoxin
MMKACRCLAAATLTLLFASAAAADVLDLELPRLDGRDFFRLSAVRGRPVVVNFWDTECPPCAREMPLLDQFSRSRPDVLMVGVSLTPKVQTRDFLDGHPVGYLQLLGPAEPRGLLRRFGDPSGALPHTVVLREDHSLCEIRTAEVSREWLDTALQRCRSSRNDNASAK